MKRRWMTVLAAAWMAAAAMAQTQVVAHRGYWDCPGSAQNSIAALVKSHEIGVYGSEFDVSITSDGVPVVNHDDDIQGHVIETTPYSVIKDLKLKNGETLPTLDEYLKKGKECQPTQMVLEIKPHKLTRNENRAVAAVVALVKKYGMEKQVDYISFSYNICEKLVQAVKGESPVYYLNGEIPPKGLKERGLAGLDYEFKVVHQHPEWITEARKLGLKTNVWTVNKKADLQWLIDHKVDFITTNKPVELQEMLKK